MSTISSGTTSTTTLVHSGDTTGSLVFKTNDTGSGGTTALTLDTSQNATFAGSTTATALVPSGASTPTNGMFLPTTNTVAWSTASTERMRIDSSGNLLVGRTSTISNRRAVFAANNDVVAVQRAAGTSGSLITFFNPSTGETGNISNSDTTTSYGTSSDYRLKHDVQPMQGALAKVAQLKPVTYKWNADNSASQGFIAHELQAVVPECVTGQKDAVDSEGKPQYQGIDTSFLVATLTAALQELNAKFDAYVATHP